MAHFLNTCTSLAMRDRLAVMFADDSAYRVLHYILGSERILEWAHSVGVATDEQLRGCVSPLPPMDLRSIVADNDPNIFLYTGWYDLNEFTRLYQKHAGSLSVRPSILDFGCGCGRMTRYLDMMREWRAFGSEINEKHVAWCQENLRNVDTRLNGIRPPLPFDDGSMDLVYSLSLFTHLPEHIVNEWLNDLARVLKPGGLLITTTHGFPALDIIKESAVHQQMFMRQRGDIIDIIERLPRDRYIFLPYDANVIAAANAGAEYGNTFIAPSYANAYWNNRHFDIVEQTPGGMRGWQDTYVMRRK
jgi:SAM-dependent methyltransferase